MEANTAIVGMWSVTIGAVGAAIGGIILANTDFFLTKPEFATVEYLENVDLRTTDGSEWDFYIFIHTSTVLVGSMKADLIYQLQFFLSY